MRAAPRISCDRTRDLISSALDGRLHDLERRFLDAHVSRCAECRAFAEEAEWFTQVIRTADQLRPRVPVTLPRRRRGVVPLRTAATAAAAAIVLVVGGNVALTAPVHNDPERSLVGRSAAPNVLTGDSIRSLRRADVVSGRLSFTAPEQATLGAVKPLVPAG